MSKHEFRVERPIRHRSGEPDGRVPALRKLLAGEPTPRPWFAWLLRWRRATA